MNHFIQILFQQFFFVKDMLKEGGEYEGQLLKAFLKLINNKDVNTQ